MSELDVVQVFFILFTELVFPSVLCRFILAENLFLQICSLSYIFKLSRIM
jgi:hypothetical protein